MSSRWRRAVEVEGRTVCVYYDASYPPKVYRVRIYPEVCAELLNIVAEATVLTPKDKEIFYAEEDRGRKVLAYYFASQDEYRQVLNRYHHATVLRQSDALKRYLQVFAEDAQKWAEDLFYSPTLLLSRCLTEL